MSGVSWRASSESGYSDGSDIHADLQRRGNGILLSKSVLG
jgi:hypothetical protein